MADFVLFGAYEAHFAVDVLVSLSGGYLAVRAFNDSGQIAHNSFVSIAMCSTGLLAA